MRNPALHDALRSFALEAAALNRAPTRARAPRWSSTWLDEVSRGGSRLYRYEARTKILHRRPLAAPLRARDFPGRGRRARGGRGRMAAGQRPARRAGRARASGHARAPVRGRHQLRLPGGALRARLPRGGADPRPATPSAHAWSPRCPGAWMEAGLSSGRHLGGGLSLVRGDTFDAPARRRLGRGGERAPRCCACSNVTWPPVARSPRPRPRSGSAASSGCCDCGRRAP